MQNHIFEKLVLGMSQVGAEEQLELMDAISYPHTTDKGRKRQHRAWYKLAHPEYFEARKVKTTDIELV